VPPEVVSGWFCSAVILNPIKLLFDIFNCNVFSCGLPGVGLSKLSERGEMEKVKAEEAAEFLKPDCRLRLGIADQISKPEVVRDGKTGRNIEIAALNDIFFRFHFLGQDRGLTENKEEGN